MKKLIVFDLDGTLVESKMTVDDEMVKLFGELLITKKVVVTGGGSFEQFKKQLINNLKCEDKFENLLLFPTNGASFYRFINGQWQEIYSYKMSPLERKQIMQAFEETFKEIDYKNPEKIYGPVIDDRGSQITFSALGQKAPIEERKEWAAGRDRRREIKGIIEDKLVEFDVVISGVTSIDVIKKGVDKSMAIKKAMEVFGLSKNEVVFVGDAIYEGGNDYAAIKTGVETIKAEGPQETKKIIQRYL